MPNLMRVLVALPALIFILHGVGWLLRPETLAETLGMPLLSGIGASTQIGDLASFFFVTGGLMAFGLLPGRTQFLYPAVCLLAGAAICRTLAAALGHADFAPQFILPELVVATLVFTAARVLRTET